MRTRGASLALLAGAIALVPAGAAHAADEDPAVVGEWTAPADIGHLAIHATLLHTGDVLLFSYPDHGHEEGSESRAVLLDPDDLADPQAVATTPVPIPYERDLFCAGHTVLADGRVFVSGGHDHTTGDPTDGLGSVQTDVFDPADNSWTAGPPLTEPRWYPSNIATPDGRVYIFGGQRGYGDYPDTVEVWDSATSLLGTAPDSATKKLWNYPAMYLMPDGSIFKARMQRGGHLFDPDSNTWSAQIARLKLNSRKASTSVLMPGGHKVMVIGGRDDDGYATETVEQIRPLAGAPRWRYAAPMHHARAHPNAVLLPNAKVLVVGGGDRGHFSDPVHSAEMYDPKRKRWELLASQVAPRMYHSTALLLPDGRVLSAGQNSGGYQTTVEIFSPPYLFKGDRPEITSVPGTLTYGQDFTLETPQAADITKASLIRPGSVTHGYNPDQRYVSLRFDAAEGALEMKAPTNANRAPPGWYMLFIVARSKVPAIAEWVYLS